MIKATKFFAGALLLLNMLSAQAGDFVMQDMQGNTLKLADYRGKWVLVNYWATWCPPCLHEIPELNSLHQAHKDRDLVVIGVVTNYANRGVVEAFLKTRPLGYPVVLGNDKVYAAIGEVDILPTSYLYAPNGKPVMMQPGEITRASIETYIKHKLY
ncbi:MAG: TlpA disulfide reductase family protein [Gallionella sp.]|nr:TlpA disulfide reductase family protein [Gallionella sp.]